MCPPPQIIKKFFGKSRRIAFPFPILMVMLLLIVSISGGAYSFWYKQDQQRILAINQAFQDASVYIAQAKKDMLIKPTVALADLGKAQKRLANLSYGALGASQQTKLTTIQANLTVVVKRAITVYGQQALVTSLPCSHMMESTQLNGGNSVSLNPLPVDPSYPNTYAMFINALTTFRSNAGKTAFYIIGSNHTKSPEWTVNLQ